MKLRIIAGQSVDNHYEDVRELKNLYKSKNLIIQGNKDVVQIECEDGRKAFFAGRLVGIRSANGAMNPCGIYSTSLRNLINTNTLEKCREMLEGRYVLAVVGTGDVCRICADCYGQRDLYYYKSDELLIATTDISLFPSSLNKGPMDQVALAYAITVYGCRPPKKQTLFQNIHRLGIGETVEIVDNQIAVSQFPFHPISTGEFGERELKEHADLLLDAIRIRGSHYGNVVYLSSGWDSTAILACLVHLFGARKVRAVIGRMKYADRSGVINPFEISRAQAVADYFGVHLDIVDLDYRQKGPDWAERLSPLIKSHNINGVTAVSDAILADFVARTTSGNESVFAGEISDGAYNFGFSQYATIFHPVLEFRQYSDKMASYLFGPTFFKSIACGDYKTDVIYDLFVRRAGETQFDEPNTEDSQGIGMDMLSAMFIRPRRLPFWSLRNSRVLDKKGILSYSNSMNENYLKEAATSVTPETLYSWYLHLYNSFHWQSSNVVAMSLTAEANGLNMALPFWDSRIQEFLSAMPENFGRGLDLNPTKYPLKWMLSNRIDYPMHLQVGPHSYLYDVEHTFNLSAELLYGSAFTPYFKDLLKAIDLQSALAKNVFDLSYVDGLITRYTKGIEASGTELSDIVAICRLAMAV
jgi:hypothetical protein